MTSIPTTIQAVHTTVRKQKQNEMKARLSDAQKSDTGHSGTEEPNPKEALVDCLFAHVYNAKMTARRLRRQCKASKEAVWALEAAQDASLEDVIDEVRYETARAIIETVADADLNAVASVCGYDRYRTFTRAFTRRTGKTPGDVQRTAAQDQ